ncbi:ParA family protein [Paenirhodobacter populi]|nr:ParA family protein [Sinirhodobacter populi]
MIVTFFSPKGGSGKSSSLLAFLSAIALKNATSPDAADQDRVLVIDHDPQGSITKFFDRRDELKANSYSIAFETITNSKDLIDALNSKKGAYDWILIDFPGHFSELNAAIALLSDRIIIPTNLELIEAQEATAFYNRLSSLLSDVDSNTAVSLMIVRIPQAAQFLPRFSKDLINQLRHRGYAVLRGMLSSQQAIPNMVNYGKYLFEILLDDRSSKSTLKAIEESNYLYRALKDWELLPVTTDEANEE